MKEDSNRMDRDCQDKEKRMVSLFILLILSILFESSFKLNHYVISLFVDTQNR